MTNDRPNEKRVEKQEDHEGQGMRFDALDLLKEGAKGARASDAAVGEQVAKFRSPEDYAKVAEKRDADFNSAMQALDRGDDAPARKLIERNEGEIALTKQAISKITGQAEQESMRAWSS